jgi:hypothetical protein
VRGVLGEDEPKIGVADVAWLRKELDDALEQLTNDAATQNSIAKQSGVQTRETKQLRSAL